MKSRWLIATCILGVSWLAGCQSPEQDNAGPSGAVEYDIPSGWIIENPTGPLRKGQYRLPMAEGDLEDAILAVYHFPGEGGSIRSNVDRWVGQFTREDGSPIGDSARIDERQVNGSPVTIVDVSGTYNASMGPMAGGGTPKPGFRMLGAIVDTAAGPWFFKLTGPERTVQAWESSFEEFVGSLKVN